MRLGDVNMRFDYNDYFGEATNTGYERLLYDAMLGDATLFQRADMVETGWCVVQPILDVWRALPPRRSRTTPPHVGPRRGRGAHVTKRSRVEERRLDAMALTRDHIVWAYRILLDRDPESDDVILPKMRGYQNTRDLRNDIVTSEEYQEKNRDYAQMNERNLVIKEIAPGLRLAIDLADHAIGLNILRGRFELNELISCGAPSGRDSTCGRGRPHRPVCDAHGGGGGPLRFGPLLRAVRRKRRMPRACDPREPVRAARRARARGRGRCQRRRPTGVTRPPP